jgi:hypothetical protein
MPLWKARHFFVDTQDYQGETYKRATVDMVFASCGNVADCDDDCRQRIYLPKYRES